MKPLKKLYIIFFLLAYTSEAQTIQLSPQAEISVITCGPGHVDLYSTFGHSAFRVQDIPNKIDRVYNYGTFSFDTDNFYVKFVRGKLLYNLSAYDFGYFLKSYHKENRWVKGQVLDLNAEEVQQVFNFLENNAKPENKSYKYDFFYDNCSTRLYDVLENVLGNKLIFNNNFDQLNYTHRDLIQLYLGNHPWGDFGIDLALGSTIDKEATSKDYLFLPDYVFTAFTKIKIKENDLEKSIVKRTDDILLEFDDTKTKNNFFTPLVVFSILAFIVIFFTYLDYKRNKRNKVLDFTIFLITGLLGGVVVLLWFATDHSTTVNNYNIFWAFAPNAIVAFLLLKSKNRKWIKNYMLALLILLDIGILLWLFKVQIYSIAVVPIFIALYIRYIYLWIYFGKVNFLSSEEKNFEL